MNSDKGIMETAAGQALRLLNKLNTGVAYVQYAAQNGMLEQAYELAKENQQHAERLAIISRSMVVCTGRPSAQMDMELTMQKEIPVEMGYTGDGWFVMKIPRLLPRKEKGSIEYIRGYLYPAMKRFFETQCREKFDSCVLIYRHIYDPTQPERQVRDVDNYEQNFVTDAVALFVMKDDDGRHCRHLYMTAPGTRERTEVYVVPEQDFLNWYAAEKSFPDAGVELTKNTSFFDEPHVPK